MTRAADVPRSGMGLDGCPVRPARRRQAICAPGKCRAASRGIAWHCGIARNCVLSRRFAPPAVCENDYTDDHYASFKRIDGQGRSDEPDEPDVSIYHLPIIDRHIGPVCLTGEMSLFETVPPNVVQSIRAFRVIDLQAEAARLGQHFLYAHCEEGLTRQQVLAIIAESFHFPRHFGKNYDALADCLTSLVYKAGSQPGFLVVLEQLPNTQKFDKEARENLLDVFRDAADFWAEKKVDFRVFYSLQ
jgi:RNAse (barnase) inhibitor barstar